MSGLSHTAAGVTALALAGLLAGLLAAPAAAQPPTADFGLLSSRVRVGDTVWVTGEDGREVQGKLWNLTARQRGPGPRRQPPRFPSGCVGPRATPVNSQ
jgi:hypothetical protein